MANAKNTLAYFKKQSVALTAVTPSSGSDGFVSIEKPDVTTGQREVLESEQLSGSISMKKPQLGFETASASCSLEMRSHGDLVTPTEPDFGALFESGIGTPNISVADAVQAAPVPSTTEFSIATEGSLKLHDFFIINNATDKKVARFVSSMKLSVIAGLNDRIDFDDGGGEENATLTAGVYTHGASSVVGSIGAHIKAVMDALSTDNFTVACALQTDGSYKYTISSDGTTLSLLNATGANTADNFLKLNLGFGAADLTGALTYTAASAVWGTRIVCRAMTTAPTAADVVYASVNYKPMNELHPYLTAGFYEGNSNTDGYLEQVIGALVSSIEATIETGALAKFNFNLAGLASARTALTKAGFAPIFEAVQGMVGFNVEIFFGATRVCANAFNVSVANEISEKRSFCPESGKIGAIIRKRTITGSINPFTDGSIDYYTALNSLTDYAVSVVIGKKDTNGFIPGQTVGIYLPQVIISQDKTGDIDDNLIEDINFTAHAGASGTERDIVISFA